MLTVGAPFAAPGDDVPGALPAGVYVEVYGLDDGPMPVRLDADVGPSWQGGGLVAADVPLKVRVALDREGQSSTWLVNQILDRQTWGISPFGEGG